MITSNCLRFLVYRRKSPFPICPQQWIRCPNRAQFFDIWQQAARGELSHWRDTLQGRLAEIIILDQFSRNLFRDSLKRLPKILLHSFLPKKPFANPASPTSFRMNAISC